MSEQKDYLAILSDALQDLDTGSGEDNRKRMGIGKSLVALGMILGDIGHKVDKANQNFIKAEQQMETLNKNLSEFNNASGKLQKWLIFWTAIIAVATMVALLK